MSYNTRRTGGGPGKSTTTQVNYHQSQRGPPVSNRNQGYSTSGQPVSYNSSAQPAYQTQTTANTGYSTTQKQQPQKPVAAAPSPVTQIPEATPSVALKQEPVTPTTSATPATSSTPATIATPVTSADLPDTIKMETSENGDNVIQKPSWKKKPFVKVPNKVKKARLNVKLRRILNPKNAVTFLNELRPQGGVKFVVREEPGWGFVATVDIDGKSFSGHALTVSKAKVQASEQALRHLLLEQLGKAHTATTAVDVKKEDKDNDEIEKMETNDQEEDGETKQKKVKSNNQEDDVPWGSLAAFALHKLFSEWQKEGTEIPPSVQEKYEEELGEEAYYTRRSVPPGEFGYPRRFPVGPFGRGRGFAPYPPRGPPFGVPRRVPPPPAATFLTGSSGGPQPSHPLASGDHTQTILPMKKIPEDANKRHPVMLLNQLKPNIVYNETKEGDALRAVFKITINLEGKQYVGRGKSKKDAKKAAAKAALAPLGIHYPDDE